MADLPLHRDALADRLRPLLPWAEVRTGAAPGPADVLVVDVEVLDEILPRVAGHVPVVAWGGYLHARVVAALRSTGVGFYVSTLARPEQVADAVRRAVDGSPTGAPPEGSGVPRLTPRQAEVLRAYVDVHRDRPRSEVAARLGISERTLKVHLAAVRVELGGADVSTRAGLRRAAVSLGLIDETSTDVVP